MAHLTVNQGLQMLGKNNYGIAGSPAGVVNAMCVSNFGTLAAGTTSVAAATNKVCNALNATPTISSQTVASLCTFLAASINGLAFTNITLHNGGAGVFTGLYGGVDAQNFTFNGVDLTVEIDDTFTSV